MSEKLKIFEKLWRQEHFNQMNKQYFFGQLFKHQAVASLSLEGEAWGSNLGPVKSNTVLPTTTRHCCNISLKEAVLPGHNDTEMSLQTCDTLA